MAPKENLFLGLKGPCDCFHMVGQHADKHDELKPGSIWLVPHCPSTAVILHPNIWVIARHAWELSTPPILGIPRWQHASNSSAPPPPPPRRPPAHPLLPYAPLVFETLSHSGVSLRRSPFPVSVAATQGDEMTFRMEGAVSWAFSTFRIGVKCNKIGFSSPKIEMGEQTLLHC